MQKFSKQFYRICLSCLLLLANYMVPAWGQQRDLKFTNYTINDGLSDGLINCVIQDHQGFMWFGTGDGLDRFDGYEFTAFQHNPFDTTSLSDNSVTALFTDSRGQLWVGTINGGLDLFDRAHNRFLHFLTNTKSPDKVTEIIIQRITEDKKGNLWMSSFNDGLFELTFSKNKKDNLQLPEKIIHIDYHPGGSNGLVSNVFHLVYVDKENRLWVTTSGDSLQMADLNQAKIHFSTPRFTVLQPKETTTKSGIHYDLREVTGISRQTGIADIAAFYEDDHHNLWVGTQWALYMLGNKKDTLIKFATAGLQGLENGNILSISKGPAASYNGNSLWLGTWNGLAVFNTKDLTLQLVQNKPGNIENLLGGVILEIYKDNSGCIWLCTNGYGVSKYDPHSALFSAPAYYSWDQLRSTNDFSVLSFLDTKNYLLLGTYQGLFRVNKNNGLMKEVNASYLVNNIIKTDSDKIWLAGIPGLTLYNPYNGKSVTNTPGIVIDGKPDNRVIKIYNDLHGGLWVLTTLSFSYFNIAKKTFTNYFYRYTVLNGIYYPFHGDICRDEKGNFWIGSEVGLLYFNTQKKTFQYYVNHPDDTSSLSFNVVEGVVPDPRHPGNYLWIATAGGGLNKFNLLTGKFTHFTKKDGLPDNNINGILPDDKGCLWISTNKGLSKFNTATNAFQNYDINEGLTSNEFNPGAYYKNMEGEFFFGNVKGFNTFYPDSLRKSSYLPPVVFTDFRLFNNPVSLGGENSPLREAISETHLITLPYNDNIINFKVAGLDYSKPYKNQYAYRLKGLSDRWLLLGADRLITLSNLSPGHYTLQVKASNSDGVWNEKGASLLIHILPPWWKTWWAYLCYAIIVFVLIWLARKEELNRLKLKNRLELERLGADKLKELDHLKSRFFTNISHEFRTPLTLILGPLNDFLKDGNAGKLKSFVPAMYRNSERLLQLINQLLDLSKLDTSYYAVNTSREDIIPFVKQIVHSFSSLAHRKNIEMETAIDPRLREKLMKEEIHFYFDEDMIEKILTNLLSNAFKFTPDGGSIIVSLGLPEKEKNFLELKVEDNGAGIPSGKIPFIFDRFYQADDSNVRQHEGSGIGLALVKELAELLQGKITAVSEPGKNTVISCYLPLDKKFISGNGKSTAGKVSGSSPGETPSEETFTGDGEETAPEGVPVVLVVEDQRDVRKYIREKLIGAYKVVEARDGKEGLETALQEIPDLVVSDVMMPVMDGFELCKKLKTDDRTSHIPVILLTARVEDSDKMTGLETGADAYLIKPFNSQELLIRINKLIEIRNKMRAKFSGKLMVKPAEIAVTSRDRLFMQRVIEAVDQHIDDAHFSVEQLGREMFMSTSQINRKLKALINQPAVRFIRQQRLQRAMEMLKNDTGSISEISFKVGFEDPGYFTKVFKSHFGCLPSETEKFPL